MEGFSCDLVCMAGLGNMAGSNEAICCPRAGNVGLYQSWQCWHVPELAMLACTRAGNVGLYKSRQCWPVPELAMLACRRNS